MSRRLAIGVQAGLALWCGLVAGAPLSDTLALTPPMGWNHWNKFGYQVGEPLLHAMADTLVSNGMRGLGYKYLNLDETRTDSFPSGMKALGDYFHGKGLKFGYYTRGNEGQQASSLTWAQWGVDYLKDDFSGGYAEFRALRDYFDATGRPVAVSICEWGEKYPWFWGKATGSQLWRTSFDVIDNRWGTGLVNSNQGLHWTTSVDIDAYLADFAGPGHWNDPDMLVVGLYGSNWSGGGGGTTVEYQSQFTLWCMLAAPLIATCDLRNMGDSTRRILTNAEAIAIDQDSLGMQGSRINRGGGLEVWKKPLMNGDIAVCLFNRTETAQPITATWGMLGVSGSVPVRDLWAKQDLGTFDGSITRTVAPHGTALLRLACGPDRKAPIPVKVVVDTSASEMTVYFSEFVESATALNKSNYALDKGITVSQVKEGYNPRSVVLSTSPLACNTAYTLTVSNIRDRARPANGMASAIAFPFIYSCLDSALAGTPIGGGDCGGGNGNFPNAFDGKTGTESGPCGKGGYVGIDQGMASPAVVSGVRFWTKNSYGMLDGVFEGSNDLAAWTVLDSVSIPYNDSRYQSRRFQNTKAYRYLRYRADSSRAMQISELTFYRGRNVPSVGVAAPMERSGRPSATMEFQATASGLELILRGMGRPRRLTLLRPDGKVVLDRRSPPSGAAGPDLAAASITLPGVGLDPGVYVAIANDGVNSVRCTLAIPAPR